MLDAPDEVGRQARLQMLLLSTERLRPPRVVRRDRNPLAHDSVDPLLRCLHLALRGPYPGQESLQGASTGARHEVVERGMTILHWRLPGQIVGQTGPAGTSRGRTPAPVMLWRAPRPGRIPAPDDPPRRARTRFRRQLRARASGGDVPRRAGEAGRRSADAGSHTLAA